LEQPELLTQSDVASTTTSVMKKLPEVTLAFWIMKIAATTLGETAGDLFAQTLSSATSSPRSCCSSPSW